MAEAQTTGPTSGQERAKLELGVRKRVLQWALGQPRVLNVPSLEPVVLKTDGRGQAATKIGICCSGGGIRSAAFCLGVLQELRARGEITSQTAVTAVSGGSYIASSFAAVRSQSDEDTFGPQDPDVYAPGSPEEQHLRNHSTYMAPGAGGKTRLALRALAGIVVNLAVITAAIAAVSFPLALMYDRIYGLNRDSTIDGSLGSVPNEIWIPLAVAFLAGLVALLPDLLLRLRWDCLRLALETWSYRLVLWSVVAAALLIGLPALLVQCAVLDLSVSVDFLGKLENESGLDSLATIGAGSMAVAALGALRTFVARRPTAFAMAAGAIAGPLTILSITIAFTLGYLRDDGGYNIGAPVALIALGASALVWLLADLTQWSLHPFYRRRLSSAFFTRRIRRPDGTLGVQEADFKIPLYMSDLSDEPFQLTVCAAANITHLGVIPPGRYATPFTFSRKSIGGPLVGDLIEEPRIDAGVSTWTEGVEVKPEPLAVGKRTSYDITLPAAVAVSGAAVSPMMGKKSRRALTMLMALLNLRLGVWIPNPRRQGEKSSRFILGGNEAQLDRRLSRRRPTPWYLVKELFGSAKVNDRFLYVSDGGHYDNLGLVELLRQGCTRIYCVDGGGDPMGTFRALGEAVALAKGDLQVDVELHPKHRMSPDKKTRIAAACAVPGLVHYLTDKVGQRYCAHIVYTRATVTEDAPQSVLSYLEKTRKFPYHSTADQLFEDEQFEAYRALGAHCGIRSYESMNESLAAEIKAKARDLSGSHGNT